MPLDEHGVPIRPIALDLFTDPKDEEAKLAEAQSQIWVTKELKATARDFFNSWHQTQTEKLAELNIDSVRIKFKDAETVEGFARLLNLFAAFYNGHLSSGVPLPASVVGSQNLVMRLELFRPEVFSELIDDLVKTDLDTLPMPAGIQALAEHYLKAFSVPFIRFDLCAGENAGHEIIATLEQTLADSQKRLVTFLKRLLESLPKDGEHRVIIRAAGEFEVDGERKDFTGAALRALLTLVLLREKSEFHVDEFAKNYNGKKPVEARHDFDNGLNALLKELPKISRTASESNRSVGGIKFRVLVPDAAITERLRNLHKKA
jgi:hypothetical protein